MLNAPLSGIGAATKTQLEIDTLERGVTCVRLSGDVDVARAHELQDSLEALVSDGHNRLLIDLSDVSFIDSTGLGVLLHISKALKRKRGRLAVCCPGESIRELFELVGHNLLFPVEDSREQALRHLAPQRRFFQRRSRTNA
jgi:anti-sigma B factor antagonist